MKQSRKYMKVSRDVWYTETKNRTSHYFNMSKKWVIDTIRLGIVSTLFLMHGFFKIGVVYILKLHKLPIRNTHF